MKRADKQYVSIAHFDLQAARRRLVELEKRWTYQVNAKPHPRHVENEAASLTAAVTHLTHAIESLEDLL